MEGKKIITNGSKADWTEVRTLPVGTLETDPGYQRDLDMPFAKKIAAEFNPDLVKEIQVSSRDGHYYVFDGQHTVTAIKIKFGNINYPVACKVYHGLTYEEEAKLFYQYNNCSRKMSAASNLKAQSAYGDEKVKAFLQHTRDAGFLIDPVKRANSRYSIQAVKKAERCYETLGDVLYDRMLSLLKQTWNGNQWSLTQNMLGGMCTLIKIFGDKIDDKIFVSQMSKIPESEIIREARQLSDESVPVAYAHAIAGFYNKGIRENKKLKRALLLGD